MNIRDHGVWQIYRPTALPEGAPANAMFARRASDGVDWYEYVRSGQNFAGDSVKMTVVDGTVAAAVTDPQRLFPGGATVLEVAGPALGDPQEAFGGKLYDPGSKSFRDPPPPPAPGPSIADLLKRLEALESRGP
jgi:hypothetical protein